jgi:membrane peptidoglycan carboxypeptidase
VVVDGKYRHLEKKLDEFPDFLKKSIIEIEDRRFYKNN